MQLEPTPGTSRSQESQDIFVEGPQPRVRLNQQMPIPPEVIGPISSTPRLGARKRRSNREVGEFIEQHGDLKKKTMEVEIENKKEKTEMFKEIKEYYKAKRQALQINNNVVN